MNTGLSLLVLVTTALIVAVISSPSLVTRRSGKVLAFVALFLLPSLITGMGFVLHLEHAKSTDFCLSCHVMEPYGTSLHFDDLSYLVADHYQNNLVPREQACYTCHTQYTMFGDVQAKLGGLKHVWVYYTGQTPETLELYQPYQNRECLHCHGASRSFVEGELHVDLLDDMRSNEVSCLECHEQVHDAANAASHAIWTHPDQDRR
ncbi:MAG: NapC/NirT family cytochrome c [Thermoanaerobaculia bacterium]|nr:NapC/NirT family cytochrome c [Thermoanaerobaculia bacterium]